MSKKTERAIELFSKKYNCAQAITGTFCPGMGMDEKTALKIAGSFGGGMRTGEVCGAVTGALMVIGLKYGQDIEYDAEVKIKCNEITLRFMEEYKKRNKTVLCRELLGYDIRDLKARQAHPGKQAIVCPQAIISAVNLLEEMGF